MWVDRDMSNALLDKDAQLTCQQQNPKRGESALRYDKYKAATSAKQLLALVLPELISKMIWRKAMSRSRNRGPSHHTCGTYVEAVWDVRGLHGGRVRRVQVLPGYEQARRARPLEALR